MKGVEGRGKERNDCSENEQGKNQIEVDGAGSD
jgi:hypothetical protein